MKKPGEVLFSFITTELLLGATHATCIKEYSHLYHEFFIVDINIYKTKNLTVTGPKCVNKRDTDRVRVSETRTVKSFCNLHYYQWTTSRHSVHACIAEKFGNKTAEQRNVSSN